VLLDPCEGASWFKRDNISHNKAFDKKSEPVPCEDPPDQADLARTNQPLAQLWLDALATKLGASAGTNATYTNDLNWLAENSLAWTRSAWSRSGTTSLLSIKWSKCRSDSCGS
jgi:hypothetical protein